MPGNPTITTFNNQTPPWQLSQLDANFASIASIINSANNYTNYLPDTGVANAYAVTFPAGIVVTIIANLGVWFKAANTNTGASTLNINATGSKNLLTSNGSALSAGMIAAGGVYFAIFDGTNYQLANPTIASSGATAGVTSRRQTVLIGPTDILGLPNILPNAVAGLNLSTQNIIPVETVYTANVTTPVSSPGVVTWTGHTLVANQAVTFTTSGALPTGLTAGTTYYVLNPAANTFNVSATPGGAAINFTGSTSGQSVAWGGVQNVLTVTAFAGNDGIVGEINITGVSSSNLVWTTLSNNTTNYLYVLVSPNGVLTPAFTTLAPIVVYGSPTAPSITSGQITINLTLSESYLGNGVSAVETPLVLVGTATTSGGNITATTTNAYGFGPENQLSITVGYGNLSNTRHGSVTFPSNGTWIFPPGVTQARVHGFTPGGGGSGGIVNANGGGGAGGGAGFPFESSWFNVVAGFPYAVTINGGAGGGAGVAGSPGIASLGSVFTTTGGPGGGVGSGSTGGTGAQGGGNGGTGSGTPTAGTAGASYYYAGGSGGSGANGCGGGGGGSSSTRGNGGAGVAGNPGVGGGGGGGAGYVPGTSGSGSSGGPGGNGFMVIEW